MLPIKVRKLLKHCLLVGGMLAGGATLIQAQSLTRPGPPYGIGPGYNTSAAPMMQSVEVSSDDTWDLYPVWTVGERIDGYRPVGIPDGMGAVALNGRVVRVFVNHELSDDKGYAYTLASGAALTGARISYFDIDRNARQILGAGMAYDTIIDRYGQVVTAAEQINEGLGNVESDGFDRFCSANLFAAGTYGLEDNIFMTGEETANGQEFALEVDAGVIHCVPALGRAAFENVTFVDTGDENTVGVLVGDDRQGGPLLLYVGQKNALGDGSFLDRNGLAVGTLHVWVAQNGALNPEDWNGTGGMLSGSFVALNIHDPAMAGMPGYDAQGFADQDTQDAMVDAVGGFRFSRPEDVATNPLDGTQVVMASTGRGGAYPSDNWGTTYLVDLDFGPEVTAELTIWYDGDDAGNGQFPDPDYGLRSPDNLDWADDGMVYIQEDRSTSPGSLFGGTSGAEASLWRLDPADGSLTRVLEMNRNSVPKGQIDSNTTDLGNWESSGVLDVTSLFRTAEGEVLLLATVQGHSLTGESLGGDMQAQDLVQGGQVFFVSRRGSQENGDRQDRAMRVEAPAELKSNWPNPFNPSTSISFSMRQGGHVRLQVFNARGQLVKTLVDETVTAGDHAVVWDGRDNRGSSVGSGIYFSRLQVGNEIQTRRMALVK